MDTGCFFERIRVEFFLKFLFVANFMVSKVTALCIEIKMRVAWDLSWHDDPEFYDPLFDSWDLSHDLRNG